MCEIIYTSLQIQTILQPVFADHKIKKAILFGSYAKGKAKKNSDVDILVDSGLRGLSFFGLLEDIVTALGKNVDLLDVSQLTSDSLVGEEIKKNGVVIYGQEG
ncbi:MAG: nucleotidyltransferase domain-containing protein [Lachnospiraceae bacterium]|nr:nucleotidyltransferase domain-containing protein [Lachnospiraceae bacterium]MDE6601736.1 nucleotidyltransferase domain-containing protein [Lachnospiraceae bacterium]